jgi:hypothetical protein
MCENCWTGEVTTFSNPADWAEFNLTLTKKLDEGQLRHNSVNHEQSIYECLACGERWKLKAPDDGSGGYLLRQEHRGRKENRPNHNHANCYYRNFRVVIRQAHAIHLRKLVILQCYC